MDNVYILVIMDDGILVALFFKEKIHYVMNWYKMHQNCSISANKKRTKFDTALLHYPQLSIYERKKKSMILYYNPCSK
jgi:hypothetical protein